MSKTDLLIGVPETEDADGVLDTDDVEEYFSGNDRDNITSGTINAGERVNVFLDGKKIGTTETRPAGIYSSHPTVHNIEDMITEYAERQTGKKYGTSSVDTALSDLNTSRIRVVNTSLDLDEPKEEPIELPDEGGPEEPPGEKDGKDSSEEKNKGRIKWLVAGLFIVLLARKTGE